MYVPCFEALMTCPDLCQQLFWAACLEVYVIRISPALLSPHCTPPVSKHNIPVTMLIVSSTLYPSWRASGLKFLPLPRRCSAPWDSSVRLLPLILVRHWLTGCNSAAAFGMSMSTSDADPIDTSSSFEFSFYCQSVSLVFDSLHKRFL